MMVVSDHKNFEFFTTTKVLNCCQVRWVQDLAGYDFKIFYCPVNVNKKRMRYVSDQSIPLRREIGVKAVFN
jgi:hypothetical protein